MSKNKSQTLGFMKAVKGSIRNNPNVDLFEDVKDVKKMQNRMAREGYHYCERHDVYYDEWNECPACRMEILLKSLSGLIPAIERAEKVAKPEDRS